MLYKKKAATKLLDSNLSCSLFMIYTLFLIYNTLLYICKGIAV